MKNIRAYKAPQSYSVISTENYAESMKTIIHTLNEITVCGSFESFDGAEIAYRYVLVDDAIGSILILHGFTEFGEKYSELTWYFINMGYNVFVPTHRGHGYSARKVDDLQVAHVDSFDEYSHDAQCFVDNVVLPICGSNLHIFSHSLGGVIALDYLVKYGGDIVDKCILSSPMITPKTKGVPSALLGVLSKRLCRKKGDTTPIFFAKRFCANPDFKSAKDACYARFSFFLQKRIDDVHFQTSMPSNRWIYESLTAGRRLLASRKCKKLTNRMLMIIPENDCTVRKLPQIELLRQLQNCRLVRIKNARHAIYNSENDVLCEYLECISEFLK